MPSSGVLILIIGSNTKKRGGAKNYNRELSIVASLPPTAASLLVQGRRRILQLITQGGYSRNKVRLADMPSNTTLVNGPEFGGDAQDGLYMPATERFHGRFFDRLGPNSIELLTNTRHHVLIVTPLYGLVAPSEPIQDHQCHINDHPNFRRVWTQDDRLTDVLLAYMRRHGITHVLDLTAQNSYRLLIAWERVRAEAKKALHCFGTQTAGSDFLIPLGFLCREILSKWTEEKITSAQ